MTEIKDLRMRAIADQAVRRELEYGPEAASLWLYEQSLDTPAVTGPVFREALTRARHRAGLRG